MCDAYRWAGAGLGFEVLRRGHHVQLVGTVGFHLSLVEGESAVCRYFKPVGDSVHESGFFLLAGFLTYYQLYVGLLRVTCHHAIDESSGVLLTSLALCCVYLVNEDHLIRPRDRVGEHSYWGWVLCGFACLWGGVCEVGVDDGCWGILRIWVELGVPVPGPVGPCEFRIGAYGVFGEQCVITFVLRFGGHRVVGYL